MKKRDNSLLNLMKSMRIERSLIPLSFIILVTSFANQISPAIFVLMFCCVIIYSAGGAINAKIDRDFKVKNEKILITSLFAIAIIASFYHYIIFFAVLAGISFGFIYSKYSRFILFGDSAILSITHAVIPIVASSLLLGLEMKLIITLSAFMFVSLWFAIPIKNLINSNKDKQLKYHTLITKVKKGKLITKILLQVHYVLMIIAYFVFDLNYKFLIILFILLILNFLVFRYLHQGKYNHAYELNKFATVLFVSGVAISKSVETLYLAPIFLIFIYVTYLNHVFKRKLKRGA